MRFAFVITMSREWGALAIGFKLPLLRVCKPMVFVGLRSIDDPRGGALASAPVAVLVRRSAETRIRMREGISVQVKVESVCVKECVCLERRRVRL